MAEVCCEDDILERDYQFLQIFERVVEMGPAPWAWIELGYWHSRLRPQESRGLGGSIIRTLLEGRIGASCAAFAGLQEGYCIVF